MSDKLDWLNQHVVLFLHDSVAEAATADLEKARDDIRVQVTRAYVQILYDMEILQVAERQVSIDSVQVERLRAMLENGKASPSELAQQEAALGQSLLTATQARNTLNLAVLDLAQLLELPSPYFPCSFHLVQSTWMSP